MLASFCFIALIELFHIIGQNLKSSRIINLEENQISLKQLIRGVPPLVFWQ